MAVSHVETRAVALVCPVYLEEAGLATNGVDRVPATALASIFANAGQSQHTHTALYGGHHDADASRTCG